MTPETQTSVGDKLPKTVAEQPGATPSMETSINPHDHIGLLYKCAHLVISHSRKDNKGARAAIQYYSRAQDNGALLEFGDLVNQGYVGLAQAAEGYDPELGHRFSTYAVNKIITTSVRTVNNRINMPVSMSIHGFKGRLNSGRPLPSCIPNEYVPDNLEASGHDYVDERLPQVEWGLVPMYDEIDVKATSVFEKADDASYLEDLFAKADLSVRQIQLLKDRYGLEDGVPRTLKELAKERGVKRQTIHEVERKALAKLRAVVDI